MFALLEAKNAGLLGRDQFIKNIISGIIVGVIALPLAMAFAIASGAKPEQGLYTAIISGFVVSILGGSRVQIAGPTGAFIIILSSINAKYGMDGLQVATLIAGIILILMGVAKMGGIIKFIPSPVIIGFTSGIAVIIWVGQWRDFFGLPVVTGEHFHTKLINLIHLLPQFHSTTTLLAFISLLLVLITPKIPGIKRIPGPLVAIAIVTVLEAVFKFKGISTIGTTFGHFDSGLPSLHFPAISWSRIIELIGPAFTIAMLGAIESLLSAVVADGMTGYRHNSNQELVGQGVANLCTPLFGGIAATGAIARTAANIRNGGTTPISGIVHSITLLLILLIFAPLAVYIPLCTLAAILFVVAWNMSEVKRFIKIVRTAPTADVIILLITFLLTVFVNLSTAVNIGVIIASLSFIRRMATSTEVKQSSRDELSLELAKLDILQLPSEVLVYSIDGPFFFGAVETFERVLFKSHLDPKYLILRFKWVPFIDYTGLQTLDRIINEFQKRDVTVLISGANNRVLNKFKRSGITKLIGKSNIFNHFEGALHSVINTIETQIGSTP